MEAWHAKNPQKTAYGILHFFGADLTREETLAMLMKSHEKLPNLFPRVDYREVDFWYKSFENKNYDMQQTPTYPLLSLLPYIPVADRIIHMLGTSEQKALCLSNERLKQFIDDESRVFEKIKLKLYTDSIELILQKINENASETVFTKTNNGSDIIKDKTKTTSELSIFEIALKDFKTIVEVMHTKIKNFTIYADARRFDDNDTRRFDDNDARRFDDTDRIAFMTGIISVMENLKEKLHVETFKVTVSTPKELDTLLGCINSSVLQELTVYVCYDENIFEMSTIKNLPACLNGLKKFTTSGLRMDMRLDSFSHIPSFDSEFVSVTTEELVNHRNKLLQLPSLNSHWIHFGNTREEMKECNDALAPYEPRKDCYDDEDENEFQGSWPIPGNTSDVLNFGLNYCVAQVQVFFVKE